MKSFICLLRGHKGLISDCCGWSKICKLRIHTPYQVVYRQNWHGRTTVLETNKTNVELQIPSGEDYLIEIKALTEGGDGTSSGPIRIPKMSSKFQIVCSMKMSRVGIKQRSSGMGALCVTNPLCDWYCLSASLSLNKGFRIHIKIEITLQHMAKKKKQNVDSYLHQEGDVFSPVCSSVNKISQKLPQKTEFSDIW